MTELLKTSQRVKLPALALAGLVLMFMLEAAAAEPAIPIERLDPRLDALLPADAKVEKLASGFQWLEGPVWDKRQHALLFTDIPDNSVYRWREGEAPQRVLHPSGYSGKAPFAGREPGANGLTMDAQGRLVLAEHGDRRIARLEADGRQTALVSRYQGKRLNSPNDLVYRANGDLYFTDPPFGLPRVFDDPAKELPFQGVYRLSAKGKLTLLIRDLNAPNGIAFSPDEKTLYVSDVDASHPAWYAYQVEADGSLSDRREFYDARALAKQYKSTPDGLKLDQQGNLYAAGPGGLYIFAPDATLLGRIGLGKATSNCAWGDDGSTLYITASDSLYRVRFTTRGAHF